MSKVHLPRSSVAPFRGSSKHKPFGAVSSEKESKLKEALRGITELRGLGKEIWHDQDAQEYVNHERDS